MTLLLFSILLLRPPEKDAVFMVQELAITLNGERTVSWTNHIAIGKSRVRVDKGSFSLIFDFRLQLFIYIDHESKTYQISNSSTTKGHLRRFFTGLTPITNGMLEYSGSYLTKLNKRKIVQGFPCQAYKLDYPEHMDVETVWWTFPHPFLSTNDYKRFMIALLGSDVPGDVKHVIGSILRQTWGIPVSIHTTMKLGNDKIEMVAAFKHFELRKNTDYTHFEIPKDYSMLKLDTHQVP
ncbi:MAG: hypothetical protein CSA81_12170 [Acidobacteria bacterium]|nr:MAG: hypothetical protein CSA81_12170 [Acidobacteriota bacterium]